MSSKVVEAGAGIHSLAMAVAVGTPLVYATSVCKLLAAHPSPAACDELAFIWYVS
jgi:hypothetical protein